jgi:hypothetical protein
MLVVMCVMCQFDAALKCRRLCWYSVESDWRMNWHCQSINPFQSNFSATRILPSSYLFWAGKKLWITCTYPTVLKHVACRETERVQPALSVGYSVVRTTWGKASDRLWQRSRRTNTTKNLSDVFWRRSGTGKSLCRTRSDVGSERVKASCAFARNSD